MKRELLVALNNERLGRRAVALVTEIGTQNQRLVTQDNLQNDDAREDLEKLFYENRSGYISSKTKDVFVTVFSPTARLVIVGAVHISQTLAPLARFLGYEVSIIDPRLGFASKERFPGNFVVPEWPDVVLPTMAIDRFTALVVLTHDPKIDDPALIHALKSECFYIGALGSRKTHAARLKRLIQQGANDTCLDRIAAPIGLPIGAVSPAEIALSIMAEITVRIRSPSMSLSVNGPK